MLKKLLLDKKGFAMGTTLGFMIFIVSLTMVVLTYVSIQSVYSNKRVSTVTERSKLESIAYDFIDDGFLTEASKESTDFDTASYSTNPNRMFILDKGTTDVRMTVERTTDGKVSLWSYDYIPN